MPSGVYALSDRSNGALDFFDAASGRFLGRATGFVGYSKSAGFDAAGPNGVVAVGRSEFWAGDGDSTVKAVDVRTRKVIASISTGGRKRADEIAYDPRDHLVIAVNNADDPPFVSFISTRTRRLVGRLELKRASDGAEQPVWNPASGLVYLSIPSLDGVKSKGAVAVIDPRTRKLLQLMPVAKCMPAGLALGPRDELLVGCSDDGISAGFPARSFVMSAATGRIVARLPQVGGSDEVWSDPKAGRYYLAAVANTGGPVLGRGRFEEQPLDRQSAHRAACPFRGRRCERPARCSCRSRPARRPAARVAASPCSVRRGCNQPGAAPGRCVRRGLRVCRGASAGEPSAARTHFTRSRRLRRWRWRTTKAVRRTGPSALAAALVEDSGPPV